MEKKRVCIIGAGVAGLICCKILAEEGYFDITLYEKNTNTGGVWSKERAYVSLATNTPWSLYCFSDMPAPWTDEHPNAEQLQDYFAGYVRKHNLKKFMQFNAEVVQAEEIKDERWKITVNIGGNTRQDIFDYLVVATGLFDNTFIPNIPNMSSFGGEIFHASNVKDISNIKDKRVLVVGSGKAAADMATVCAKYSSRCLMIFRKAHWTAPRVFFGFPIRSLFFSKVLQYLIPYDKLSVVDRIIHSLLEFPKSFLWSASTAYIKYRMNYPATCSCLLPEYTLINDASAAVITEEYYEAVRTGVIEPDQTEILQFKPDSKLVEFKNGKCEEFDAVIFATGHAIRFPFFSADLIQKLNIPTHSNVSTCDTPFKLYKRMVPINGPRTVAFAGMQNCNTNTMLFEIQANWINEYFMHSFCLPTKEIMAEEVDTYLEFERKLYPKLGGLGFCCFYTYIRLIDDMLCDIKVSTTRTTNFISEYLLPQYPSRYQITKERIQNRTLPHPPKQFYFSFSFFMTLVCCVLLLVYIR